MSEKILDATEDDETPMSADEAFANLLQDIVLNEDPKLFAGDFIEEFVLQERPETSQILAMLEMPTENLIEMVKQIIEQGYQAQNQAVDKHGFNYLEGLKAEVRAQMTEIAEQ